MRNDEERHCTHFWFWILQRSQSRSFSNMKRQIKSFKSLLRVVRVGSEMRQTLQAPSHHTAVLGRQVGGTHGEFSAERAQELHTHRIHLGFQSASIGRWEPRVRTSPTESPLCGDRRLFPFGSGFWLKEETTTHYRPP